MKPIAHAFDLPSAPVASTDSISWCVESRPLERAASRLSLPGAVRVVGLMAFAQSVAFLILWLLVCASAGAAPTKRSEFNPVLQLSSYQPSRARDPFGKVGFTGAAPKAVPGSTITLQLEGILFEKSNPSAIVNGHLLTLDKTVTLSTTTGEVEVRATEITRDHVVVQAGEQKVELRLNPQKPESR